ncbi:hypothetical protein LTR51_007752 [Lithohypha guttulata]|nr:hypothetical protein LTR51_007752 [Lithohypha guttulata]
MSARLSPAASLLRNSKLFALPPTIALPPKSPTSDQISSSDTATTKYPQHAAINTTVVSHNYGDWGFKRPLPAKSTRSTNNPVVRLVQGIDTPEQIADFESAADHVLTLRKFQELNIGIQHMPVQLDNKSFLTDPYAKRMHNGVFRSSHDNTTNLVSSAHTRASASSVWPNVKPEEIFDALPEKIKRKQIEIEQATEPVKQEEGEAQLLAATKKQSRPIKPLRWRYAGPSLVKISGQEFDEYLRRISDKERELLDKRIRQDLVEEKTRLARESGQRDKTFTQTDITEGEVKEQMRYLRNEPRKFGPIIAEILDLPEVESEIPGRTKDLADLWEYGRSTLAAGEWSSRGPPRTHPSAGLSYIHTNNHVNNDPKYGPQSSRNVTVARVVKARAKGSASRVHVGLAGFIVPPMEARHDSKLEYMPKPGGNKVALRPTVAYVHSSGAVRLHAEHTDWTVDENDRAVSSAERAERSQGRDLQQPRGVAPAPRMSSTPMLRLSQLNSSRRADLSPDVDDFWASS